MRVADGQPAAFKYIALSTGWSKTMVPRWDQVSQLSARSPAPVIRLVQGAVGGKMRWSRGVTPGVTALGRDS